MAISWVTRPISGSAWRGMISTSQSITHLLRLEQELIEGSLVAAVHGPAELSQPFVERGQGRQDGVAIVQEDGGPQGRIAGRDARGAAEAARGEVAQLLG